MKKLLTVYMFITLCVSASGQVQTGKVRTAGTPDRHGEPLNSVVVTMRGGYNSVLTNSSGQFEVLMKGVSEGDAIGFERVSKNNYVLLDEDVLYTEYSFSRSVPIEIVMKSIEEINKERKEIIERSQAAVRTQYDSRIQELEAKLESESITADYYISQYNLLLEQKTQYEKMIGSIADHYSKIDYDRLDELDRQITHCISMGDFDKADSLLNTKGDLNARLVSHQEEQAIIASREKQLLEDKSANKDNGRRLAADFFNKHTVAFSRFDVDSAAYFIEKRVEVDTTDWVYLYTAATFLYRYKAEFNKAAQYLYRALHHSDNINSQVLCYLRLGEINTDLAAYDKAAEYYRDALMLFEGDESEDLRYKLDCYYCIGNLEFQRGNYETALEYYHKVLDIVTDLDNNGYSELTRDLFLSMAATYNQVGEYDESDEYMDKALSVSESIDDYYSQERAAVLRQYAYNYVTRRNFNKAEELYLMALDINLKINTRFHPDVASLYNDLGLVCENQKKANEALEYHNEALNIRLALFGERHPAVANSYNSIASLYKDYKMYDEAMRFFEKALEIRIHVLGENHDAVATVYNNIATIHANEGRYEEARESLTCALEIYKKIFGDRHYKVGHVLLNLGTIDLESDEQKAAQELEQFLDIVSESYGSDSHNMAAACYDVALVYYGVDDDKSLTYMLRAKDIYEKDGFEGIDEALILRRLAALYARKDDFRKCLEYQHLTVSLIDNIHANTSNVAIQMRWELYDYYFKWKNIIQSTDLDEWNARFSDFMSSYSVSVDVKDPESPATLSGLSGRYEILQFNAWTIDSTDSFFDEAAKANDTSKDVFLYKDGEVIKRRFEHKIGVIYDLIKVAPEDKCRMVDSYKSTTKE